MANPGLGNKFVSVNLNKSYGQPPPSHHSSHPSSYGSNRSRPGSHGGSGGGGGMVVLSRPRSSQKTGPKLSVPPPLNLPSLRKEHEKFDSSGSSAGPLGGGVSRTGQRSTSASMGWTKPGSMALQEKEEFSHSATNGMIDQILNSVSEGNKGTSAYTPPSARLGMAGTALVASVSMSSQSYPTVDKATTVLRGEDFPSLQAALPSASGPSQKQKDSLNQKQKQAVGESYNEDGGSSRLGSHVDMRPQSQLSHHRVGNGENENRGEVYSVVGPLSSDHSRKQEDIFLGSLPLVQLNPRSNWAEDERDTGHGLTEKGRDHGFSKSEAYWDADFDMPRINSFFQKPGYSDSARWGQHDDGIGKVPSSEVPRVGSYGRDVRMPSREGREGNFWRNSTLPKDGFNASENAVGVKTSSLNRETNNNNKYVSSYRDNAHENIGRRDVGYGHGGRQPWNNTMDSYSSHSTERMRDRYGTEQHNRQRFDVPQNRSPSKPSYHSGNKGLPVTEPLFNFGRDKRPITKNEKPYSEDPFSKDFGGNGFDGRDPFTGGLVGVIKRKKDVTKQTDFHDPVRESFEAELQRVQKMQEQERQRIIEEQERVLELARREEEERMRLVREQEETQKKLEEEAREAAWRAEQEQMDAIQRAEEQRIAREEEKRRIAMEEERRKQAAKQKLLELEERIARRKAESVKSGSNALDIPEEKILGMGKEKDVSRVADMDGDWEDGERMVERITTSASSESSSLNRSFEMGFRTQFSKGGPSGFVDRGKPVNSWRRDFNENGSTSAFFPQDHGNGHSPGQDSSMAGRPFYRKELPGGSGFMSDSPVDDYTHLRGQRWSFYGDGDHFDRNMGNDSKFPDNVENFGDLGWGQGRNRGNLYSPYPDRLYPDSEADGAYSFGRARYSMRQPRVLPPPTLAAMHKSSPRTENEQHGSSTFLESEMQYNPSARNDSTMQAGYNIHPENLGQPAMMDMQHENTGNEMQKADRTTAERCDSQSTLSVSSPPSSPTPLSHDDLDESDSLVLSSREGKALPASIQENEAVDVSGKEIIPASAAASTGDEDEWAMENNEHLQEQEEYDEDEDGYIEEDEVHEGDDENLDLSQEFEDMHLEEKESSHMMENLVLGFNEGVEVGMPNDEFERNSGNEDSMQGRVQVSREEKGSFEGLQGDEQKHQSLDGSSQVSVEDSSRIFHNTENAIQDMVIQPHNAPQANASSSSLLYVQQPVSSPVIMAPQSSSGQAAMSNASSLGSQTEVPVKLQFGLFSGPSLIPFPVPAIQIGSIQMPLHLHPQINPSLSQMHPSLSQPPLFQFGHLRYTSSANQGVVPLAPQSVSFIQPNVQGSFPSGQNLGCALSLQPAHNQPGDVSRPLKCQVNLSGELSSIPSRENIEHTVMVQQGGADISGICDNNVRSGLDSQDQTQGCHSSALNNVSPSAKESGVQPQIRAGTVDSVLKERDLMGSKARGQVSGGRGNRYVFTVKGSGSRSPFPASDINRSDSSGLQRRPRRNTQRAEFHVRESMDKRQYNGNVSSNNHYGFDDRSNVTGRVTTVSARSGRRNVGMTNKLSRQTLDPENINSAPNNMRELNAGNWVDKGSRTESLTKNRNIPQSGEGKLKRNICSEEEVDAPLQSGVVCVFEQPGIEAPSDEDDFIEVRSKRQMLNDRREQREKEVKAKYRVSKIPRKPRAAPKSTKVSANLSKISSVKDGEAPNRIHSDFVATDGGGLGKIEVSSGFNTSVMSQQLAPIGTPSVKSDPRTDIRSQSLRSIQRSALPLVDGGKNLGPGSIFDSKNDVLDSVQPSYSSWSTSRVNQQVMNLTQTQLDEAMKPAHFSSHPPVGEHTTSVTDPNMTLSSILPKDKSFSSTTNPIDSLLAGEKIQFGAVTSPSILPASNRATLHGIGPPGPSRSEIQISHVVPGAENVRHSLFDKEKHTSESCTRLEESEAEAEAAASAVAVAAISSDETVSTGLGMGSCSVSVSDTQKFGGSDINGVASGSAVDDQSSSQSRTEESLSVALPADLSVETLSISLWPPLPSPQNSSSQMLSHFPGGAPSHFPFYEINPILGGPMVAYGPHNESASIPQSQPQKSSAPSTGPLGTWQQCHSGVDSFYGPPAGFSGPFISPGGIPGVQGPPHMVVYNHFAPVGQFGQVGLSFMGATYIPSGKQPDWKHNPTSTNLSVEGDMNNMNMASGQRNQTPMPPPVQQLAPGSSLLPMASPLAMFDVSPFQPSPDLAQWPHVPPSSMQSMHMPMVLQQQAETILHSQLTHGPSIDQSLSSNSFPNSQACTEKSHNFSIATDSTVIQLPDELGMVDVSSSIASTLNAVAKNSANVSKTNALNSNSENSNVQNTGFISKTHLSQNKGISNQLQYRHHSSGYNNYQRGGNGASQKSTSGGEWAHRRMGFQGRNNQSSVNANNRFPSSKVKQIYVAKQTSSGSSSSTTAPFGA